MASVGSNAASADDKFNSFYSEVKRIEQQDAVLTSAQQIERLLRPGATYRNLNPFDVLQVDPSLSLADLKKKYKRLSILVHPDKNPDDKERAQTAFDIVNKAFKTLEDETTRQLCLDIVEEAQHKVNVSIEEKRKRLKKEGKSAIEQDDEEDDFKRQVQVLVMKLFADKERKRRDQELRNQEERKRLREQELLEEENKKFNKEWKKNFEESREGRVSSWHSFNKSRVHDGADGSSGAGGGSKKKKKKHNMGFRPPKLKPETR